MRALFGAGAHPNRDAMLAAGATKADTRLGSAYPTYSLADGPTTRRPRRAVAGYDLVFTPVKSASLLWALGGANVRAAVEAAHHDAVSSTIGWVEKHAAYTRTGHSGAAQVDTTGLVCAAFDHRESRSSDPGLHTHVAVATRCVGSTGGGGRWTRAACTHWGWRRRSATTRGSRTHCPVGSAWSSWSVPTLGGGSDPSGR